MGAFEEIRNQLQELIDLVRLDTEYCSAVAHNAIIPDQVTAQAHQARATRIVELKRNYGLK